VSFTKEILSGAKGLTVLQPTTRWGTGFEMRRYRTDDHFATANRSRLIRGKRVKRSAQGDNTTAPERAAAPASATEPRRQARLISRAINLPLTAILGAFAPFSLQVSLKHMKNKQKNERSFSEASQEKQEKKTGITSLPRMEMYAVFGLELGQKIFEKLQKMEDSLEILARQKARELNPNDPDAEPDQ
jgi:hypothetical protein